MTFEIFTVKNSPSCAVKALQLYLARYPSMDQVDKFETKDGPQAPLFVGRAAHRRTFRRLAAGTIRKFVKTLLDSVFGADAFSAGKTRSAGSSKLRNLGVSFSRLTKNRSMWARESTFASSYYVPQTLAEAGIIGIEARQIEELLRLEVSVSEV